jgi:hypothetical protein
MCSAGPPPAPQSTPFGFALPWRKLALQLLRPFLRHRRLGRSEAQAGILERRRASNASIGGPSVGLCRIRAYVERTAARHRLARARARKPRARP